MIPIDNKFKLGEFVKLTTGDGETRVVTSIRIDLSGSLLYQLSLGVDLSYHFEAEMVRVESWKEACHSD